MKNNHQGPQIYFKKFCKLAEMQGGKVISEEKDYIDLYAQNKDLLDNFYKDVIKVEIDADNHFYQRNKVSDTFGAELH